MVLGTGPGIFSSKDLIQGQKIYIGGADLEDDDGPDDQRMSDDSGEIVFLRLVVNRSIYFCADDIAFASSGCKPLLHKTCMGFSKPQE